jgi:hypothetical protein
MDVENQLSHAYILVERMLTGETALEDFVSSGETKARFRPDVSESAPFSLFMLRKHFISSSSVRLRFNLFFSSISFW